MTDKLTIGDDFPTLTFKLAGGGHQTVPADMGEGYKIVLFYRDHW